MRYVLVLWLVLGATAALWARAGAEDGLRTDDDGTIHAPAFAFPESSYLSKKTREALKRNRDPRQNPFQVFEQCPNIMGAARERLPEIRRCQAEEFYRTPFYKSLRNQFPVRMEWKKLGGVDVEVFEPIDGVAPRNEMRVLINLHGGGLFCCARVNSHLESIPIASIARIKVISVDYREGPEYPFPAASEDVAAVYRELLKAYRPTAIGLFGCSSGGALVAQSVAWFQAPDLPAPGAVGMFCGGADRAEVETIGHATSDSFSLHRALDGLSGEDRTEVQISPYYRSVNRKSRLASPGDYDDTMRRFPPSLLMSGTRDFALSSVLVTHAQLVRLGVKAQLHVWEGMGHGFFYYPYIPEAKEAYNVIATFFSSHLRS